MELIDVSDIFAKSEFRVLPVCHRKRWRNQMHRRARLRGILPQGSGRADRVREGTRGEGTCHSGAEREGLKGTAAKFVKPEEAEAVKSKVGAREGDLILFAADQRCSRQ